MVDLYLNRKGFLLIDACLSIMILSILTTITLSLVKITYETNSIRNEFEIESESFYEETLFN